MTVKNPATAVRTPRAQRVTLAQVQLQMQQQMESTQEQLGLIHAVLEELCERQEAVAAWQMEFSKRIVMLSESHWRALEELTGSDFGNPVERAFSDIGPVDPENLDKFDEMGDNLDALNNEYAMMREDRRKSEIRRSKKRDKELPPAEIKDSIMIVPTKRTFN